MFFPHDKLTNITLVIFHFCFAIISKPTFYQLRKWTSCMVPMLADGKGLDRLGNGRNIATAIPLNAS